MAEKTEEARRKALEEKRRLASKEVEEGATSANVGEDDLDDVLDKLYQASIAKPKTSSAATTAKPASKNSGGWKSGFLSGPSKPVKKATNTTTGPATTPSSSTPSSDLNQAAAKVEPSEAPAPVEKKVPESNDEVNKKRVIFNPKVSEQSENRVEGTAPLKSTPKPAEVIPEEPRENVFSQQKHLYHHHNPSGATGGMKPLPKIPKGETTKIAFTGAISERS